MNITEAIKATRNGAIAASISAGLTIVMIVIAIKTNADGELGLWNDPANFIDVAFVLACAVGMYRKSRAASVLVFIYFLVSKIIIAIETQVYSGIFIAIVFLYFFGKAIQGSFTYHSLKKAENPDYITTSVWAYVVGVPAAFVFVLILSFGLLSATGILPSTKVQSASEIGVDDIRMLRDYGVIYFDDTIIYIYSQGLTSVLESGSILTLDSVIIYGQNENNEIEVYDIPLHEITDVVLESQGGVFTDSVYRLNTEDPDKWARLYLPTEQDGDRKFVEALRGMMSAS